MPSSGRVLSSKKEQTLQTQTRSPLHCFDAATGKEYWVHDTESNIWSSPLVADGKVYIANEDGILTVLAAGKTVKVLGTVELNAPVYASPIAANGVLYITSMTHLYAVGKK